MSKFIEVREGNKVRYLTKEAYEKYIQAKGERKTSVGDITCSGAKSVGMGFTEEQFNRIFGKKVADKDKK